MKRQWNIQECFSSLCFVATSCEGYIFWNGSTSVGKTPLWKTERSHGMNHLVIYFLNVAKKTPSNKCPKPYVVHFPPFIFCGATGLGRLIVEFLVHKSDTNLRAHTHTHTHTAVINPLNEWSARRRGHNLHNRKTTKSPERFEPAIPAIEWPQTYTFTSVLFPLKSYVQISIEIFFKTFISDSTKKNNVRRFILNFHTIFLGPIHSIAKLPEANSMALLWNRLSVTLHFCSCYETYARTVTNVT
jgi:hypothetical protein